MVGEQRQLARTLVGLWKETGVVGADEPICFTVSRQSGGNSSFFLCVC